VASAEGGRIEGVEYGECRELSQQGPGCSLGWKCILAYLEGHRMLLFAPITTIFGGKAKVWAAITTCLNVEPHLPKRHVQITTNLFKQN